MTQSKLDSLILATQYSSELVQTINTSAVTLNRLRKVVKAGNNCAWVLSTDGYGATAFNFAEGDDFSTFDVDPQLAAVLPWARYGNGKNVSGTSLRATASANPEENERLYFNALGAAVRVVVSTLNADAFDGSGVSNNLVGMETAFGTGTYAGVARGDAANYPFRGNVFNAGGGDVATSLQLMRDNLNEIADRCGEMPDITVCPSAVYDLLSNQFDETRQYVDSVLIEGNIKQNLRYGANDIWLEGSRLVRDRQASAKKAYFINTNYVWLQINPPRPIEGDTHGLLQANDGTGPTGFAMELDWLGKTGDSVKMVAQVECQLVVSKPSACGIRHGIVAPSP